MTSLSLSEAPPPDPVGSIVSRIKWSMVVPWLVTAAMFSANGYHRFLSGEQASEANAKTIVELKHDVDGLKTEVSILKAIMIRVEAQQSADVLARMGRRVR